MAAISRKHFARIAFCAFMLTLSTFNAAAEERKEKDASLAQALEAAAQAKEAANQAKEQVKELSEKLEKALTEMKEAVKNANDAVAQAKEAVAILNAREAVEREKEAKIEAARKAREAEIKEAAAEDEAEKKKNSEAAAAFFEGRLTLYTPDMERASPDAVGEFESNGKKYIVKLGSPDVMKELMSLEGKQGTVNGKIRNKGKYLIVMSVPPPGAAPTYTRKRGGI
jgi:chromosome segregation ATPase